MSLTQTEPIAREQLLDRAREAAGRVGGNATTPGESVNSLIWALGDATCALVDVIAATLAPAEQPHDSKPAVEDGWYEIELMGHRVRTGHLRTVAFAGRQLVEITEPAHPIAEPRNSGDDDPELKPARVEFYSPTAIFSLSRTTEDEAIKTLTERSYIPF